MKISVRVKQHQPRTLRGLRLTLLDALRDELGVIGIKTAGTQ